MFLKLGPIQCCACKCQQLYNMEILCKCKAFVFTCGQNFYTYTYIIVIYIYIGNFLIHTLVMLVLFLELAGLPRFLTTTRRKGVNLKFSYIYIYIYIPLTRDLCKYLSDAFTCPCVNVLEHVAIYQYNKRCPYLSNDFTGF